MAPVPAGGNRKQETKEVELPPLSNIAADPRIREHLRNVAARLCRGNVLLQGGHFANVEKASRHSAGLTAK
jgi:hypothetical protein